MIVQKYDGTNWSTIGDNFTSGKNNNLGNILAEDDGKIYVSYHTSNIPGPPNWPGYEIMVLSGCEGCTDATATNYDSTATVDDGSCIYPANPTAPCTTTNGCTDTGTTTVPDSNFEAVCEFYLTQNSGGNYTWDGTTLDGQIDNTYTCNVTGASGINNMNPGLDASSNYVNDCVIGNITDITGIKAFGCLVNFQAWGQSITSADFSGMQYLERIDVSWNQIASVDLTGCVALTHFLAEGGMSINCGDNPTSCNALGHGGGSTHGCTPWDGCVCSGDCIDHRKLTSFSAPDSPNLKQLYLGAQPLTSIDISNNTNLEFLAAGPITLSGTTIFDLSNHDKLEYIFLTFTNLTKLILSENLDLTAVTGFVVEAQNTSSQALTIAVGAGDVPGTTGGTGAGGLKTRVEYCSMGVSIFNFNTCYCCSSITFTVS